jgi:hypothetical protein
MYLLCIAFLLIGIGSAYHVGGLAEGQLTPSALVTLLPSQYDRSIMADVLAFSATIDQTIAKALVMTFGFASALGLIIGMLVGELSGTSTQIAVVELIKKTRRIEQELADRSTEGDGQPVNARDLR